MALVDGFVSVFEEVFVAGVILEGELSRKLTWAFVGVDFAALVLSILGFFSIFGWAAFIVGTFAPNLRNVW